jgi:hypothetical protein
MRYMQSIMVLILWRDSRSSAGSRDELTFSKLGLVRSLDWEEFGIPKQRRTLRRDLMQFMTHGLET